MKYVALLRGINVGGNNIIKMADLRDCFEQMGFTDIQTYIQSGNVVFSAPRSSNADLVQRIGDGLAKQFDYHSPVHILSGTQFQKVIDDAPRGFGNDSDHFRYDVIFIRKPLTAASALEQLPLREGVDTAAGGTHALYFSRVKGQESKSKLHKIVGLTFYKDITIRNWNTTSKIYSMIMD